MSHLTKLVKVLLVLTGLLPAGVALAALVGLGVMRDGFPPVISVGAVGVALLPAVGLAGLTRFKPEALSGALWLWSSLLLIGLPTWFPGERADAIATGFMWFGALGGEETAQRAAALGERVAALLGPEVLSGTPPAPELEPVSAPPPPPRPEPARAATARLMTEDQVVLPYEGKGRSLRVPVSFDSDTGDEEIWMLFDTGATFTTLDEATLRTLGVPIPRDAPEVTLQTAGGARQAKLVLIDRIWLGGFPVDGVTVAICEPCSDSGVSGLLGLNVSGQFQVTLDHDQQEMVLKPRTGTDRHLDIGEWLDISTRLAAWTDGRMELTINAANVSDREIRDAEVAIQCPDERFNFTLKRMRADDTTEEKVSLPRHTSCPEYRVSLERAVW